MFSSTAGLEGEEGFLCVNLALRSLLLITYFVSLESNSFFSPFQHGFRKHYPCETRLLCFAHNITSGLNLRSSFDCVFLNLAKAFDEVPYHLLLLKISTLNIDLKFLEWLECFFFNKPHPIGFVLSHLLFLIFINDISNCIHFSIKLFAGDCVLCRQIINQSDNYILQSKLDSISNWCENWQMSLDIRKCKSMTVSGLSDPP